MPLGIEYTALPVGDYLVTGIYVPGYAGVPTVFEVHSVTAADGKLCRITIDLIEELEEAAIEAIIRDDRDVGRDALADKGDAEFHRRHDEKDTPKK